MSAIDADPHEHQTAPLQPGAVELVHCQGLPQGRSRPSFRSEKNSGEKSVITPAS